jgi:long-chain acyl-CoA synthetase
VFDHHYRMMATDRLRTIPAMLASTLERRADERALGFIHGGTLQWRTWREVADAAARLAAEMRAAGIEPGDRVAHVSENRYEWVITDLALHLAAAVHVPIHVTLSGQQIAEQIVDCGARLVFVSNGELLSKFAELVDTDVAVWLHDEQGDRGRTALLGEPAVAPEYIKPPAEPGADVPRSGSPAPGPKPADVATILYTSGTTGRPRGVMLSQRNLASNAAGLVEAFGGEAEQTRLCILPLSHIYARTCDLYTWVCRGCRLVIGESRETLHRDCQLARPTALAAVPYVYQRIADRIRCGDEETESRNLRVFFGGSMETLSSGGAPLPPSVETWYIERGMPILPGYGLTETSPVIAVSTPKNHRVGSVGRLLQDVAVRIAEDGEILARGPNIMQGYWKNAGATEQMIRGGWLYTGDLGELDAEGFLYIRGRKKELIALSTGKKVALTRVEAMLTASPLIEQAAVFGEGLTGLVALVVPSAACLERSQEGAARSEAIAAEIERCLATAACEEQVRQFRLLDRAFSMERGEMTAKLSLCRAVIAKNFAAELEAMKPQRDSAAASPVPAGAP